MGKTTTNLAIALGLITIAFAGYYMYVQQSATTLNTESADQTMQNILNNTRAFIEYRKTLDEVSLDISLFENNGFNSLRSFSTPIQEQPIGRSDPFADVDIGETSSI